MLAVRRGHFGKIGIAVESEEGCHVGVAGCVEEPGGPAQRRRREAE